MGQYKWFGACVIASVACVAVGARGAEDEAINAAARRVHAAQGVIIDAADNTAQQRIEAALREPLRSPLDFIETPLNTVVQAIAEEYEIPILFDVRALESVAQSPDTEVSITIGNVTLRSALDLLVESLDDITYIIDHEVLVITTEDEAQTRLEVRVYRVDDLIVSDPREVLIATDADYERLIDIVVSSVDVESWMRNGRGEGEIRSFAPGMLVVSQTRRAHEQVRKLLATLRSIKADVQADASGATGPGEFVTRGIPISPEVAKSSFSQNMIRDTLMRSVNWDEQSSELANQVSLAVLPTHVLVRHKPAIVRKVVKTVQDLALSSPSEAAQEFGQGDGASSEADKQTKAEAADDASETQSGNRRRRGGF
jgi:hypothetical protein